MLLQTFVSCSFRCSPSKQCIMNPSRTSSLNFKIVKTCFSWTYTYQVAPQSNRLVVLHESTSMHYLLHYAVKRGMCSIVDVFGQHLALFISLIFSISVISFGRRLWFMKSIPNHSTITDYIILNGKPTLGFKLKVEPTYIHILTVSFS